MESPSILIVDDEPIICQILSKLFRQQLFQVEVAATAGEALALFEQACFDVAIIDINLPDMKGASLLRKIKAMNPDTSCTLITGHPSLDSAINAIETGADGYFTKPIVPVAISMRIEEIIRQKRLEKELKDSEARYRGLVESSQGHIFMLDRQGCYLASNNRIDPKVLQLSESVVGKHLKDVYPPDVNSIYVDKLAQVFSTEKAIEFEYSLSQNGDLKYYIDVLYPILRDETVWAAGGICRDVTERKKTEEALRSSNESLAEAQRIARLGIRDWDLVTGEITWSGEAYRIYGQDPDKKLFFEDALAQIHPDDREAFKAFTKNIQKGTGENNIEYRINCTEGMKIVHEQGKIVKDETGLSKRMLGIFRDVTEEKKLRQESQYRLQQVIQADKLASLGEVVAGVAHEINNPNSFISYNVPLLEETWQMLLPIIDQFAESNPSWRAGNMGIEELRKDMADIIQAIKTGSDRIKKVVSNLKEFARLDDSEQMKPVQINEVIENTLTIVGARLRKAVRKVRINLAKGLPPIPGHFQKLEQVVANLALNAANAINDKDQGLVRIHTRFLNWAKAVIIEVEDNGKGMPQEVVSRIFDPFFTTRRESGGTGLGLSVTYGLVQEHNGVISVLSHPDVGSKFTVYLPTDSEKKPELRPAILCVDDDPEILRLLHTFFMSVKNVSLDTLQNPEEVLDYLQAHPEVDIVLSDIWMPNLDGWQLYKQIKSQFPLLSVILYSGDTDALNRKPPDIPLPTYFFKKPLSFKQLMKTVNSIGRQRHWK